MNVNVFNHWSPAVHITQACLSLFNAADSNCSNMNPWRDTLALPASTDFCTLTIYRKSHACMIKLHSHTHIHTQTLTHTHKHTHTHTHAHKHTLWTLKDDHPLWMIPFGHFVADWATGHPLGSIPGCLALIVPGDVLGSPPWPLASITGKFGILNCYISSCLATAECLIDCDNLLSLLVAAIVHSSKISHPA